MINFKEYGVLWPHVQMYLLTKAFIAHKFNLITLHTSFTVLLENLHVSVLISLQL